MSSAGRGPQLADQVSKRQQAIDGERAAAIRDDCERIGRPDIGPPSWQGEQRPVLVMHVDAVLTPVLPVRDELEVLAVKRVEPVGHPDPSVQVVRIGCS